VTFAGVEHREPDPQGLGSLVSGIDQFNRSTLDAVGPIGGREQGMKALRKMNSLVDDHDEFVKCLGPRVDGL
jgi:hypothetical protein